MYYLKSNISFLCAEINLISLNILANLIDIPSATISYEFADNLKDSAYSEGMADKPLAGHFRLLYFAAAASFTRKTADDLPAPLPVQKLFALLESKYPGMIRAILSSSAVTVNLDYVDIEGEQQQSITSARSGTQTVIMEGDEVAIIPPVSSG